MSAADFGVKTTRPQRATVAQAIASACNDIASIGSDEDKDDVELRTEAIISMHGVIHSLGTAMLNSNDRIAAAGILAEAVTEIGRHITASRAELLAFDE